MDDDAIAALLLDDRLGDAELVDTIAQNRDVLLNRAILNALLGLGLQSRDEPKLAARRFLFAYEKIGKCYLDRDAGLVALGLILESQHDVRLLASDAAIDDALFTH